MQRKLAHTLNYSNQKLTIMKKVISVSPVALMRLGSILFVLLTIGHVSAYPWTSDQILQEKQLVGSMKSVDLVFVGEHSSYWNLYYGWGLWVAVLLLTLAIILWLLSGIAPLAPRRVGVITAILSITCLAGAYISFRFFYIPPFLMLAIMFVILLTAAMQLLRISRVPG
jgi:hypothetical protein